MKVKESHLKEEYSHKTTSGDDPTKKEIDSIYINRKELYEVIPLLNCCNPIDIDEIIFLEEKIHFYKSSNKLKRNILLIYLLQELEKCREETLYNKDLKLSKKPKMKSLKDKILDKKKFNDLMNDLKKQNSKTCLLPKKNKKN